MVGREDGKKKQKEQEEVIEALEMISHLAVDYKQFVRDNPMEESELEQLSEDGWIITGPPTAWGGPFMGKLIYLFFRPKLKVNLQEELELLSEEE